jgi:nucleoid DNA-binding protein
MIRSEMINALTGSRTGADRAARNGRNRATRDDIGIKVPKVPAFTVGTMQKAAVNGARE